MTTAYVYKWTHLPTLKWYVGSRTAKGCHPDDGYICSAPAIKKMVLSNLNEWERTIIKTGEPLDMYEYESMILQLFNARRDLRSFNKHNNDKKFMPPIGEKRPGIGGVKKGNVPWNKGKKETRLDVLERIKSGAQNCEQGNRGRKTGFVSEIKGKTKNDYPNLAHDEDTKKTISKCATAQWEERKKDIQPCPHCGKTGIANSGAMKRWHFDNCKDKK
jgi:hypothetical protein